MRIIFTVVSLLLLTAPGLAIGINPNVHLWPSDGSSFFNITKNYGRIENLSVGQGDVTIYLNKTSDVINATNATNETYIYEDTFPLASLNATNILEQIYFRLSEIIVEDVGIAIGLVTIGSSTLFIFLGVSFKREHEALTLLFVAMGMFLVGTSLGVINTIAIEEGAGSTTLLLIGDAITVVTWTIYVGASYFMIMFLWRVMRMMLVKNNKKREG